MGYQVNGKYIISKFVIVLLLIFNGISHTIPSSASEDVPKVKEQIQSAVVKIIVYGNDKMGILSGAVVHSSGIILTSFFGDEGEYTVEFTNGLKTPATIIAKDDVFQLATLQIEQPILSAVPIAKEKVIVGEKVYASGFISSSFSRIPDEFVVTEGRIKNVQYEIPGMVHKKPGLHISTDIDIEMAMNLLFNSKGELVSVTGMKKVTIDNQKNEHPLSIFYPLTNISDVLLEKLIKGK
ncbi:trypsin-like peptidase domain-containing protein [Candidatus Omnitrophota bacterium]